MIRRIPLIAAILASLSLPALADPGLEALLAAYPDQLAYYSDTELVWKDGSRLPLGVLQSNLPFDERLNRASIRDQLAIPYPLADVRFQGPAPDIDPGRLRNEAFFVKMYGDCRKGEVAPRLKSVPWLPSHGGGSVRVTAANGVAEQLEKVSQELDRLPAALVAFLVPASGTYNCRPIAETNRLSVHAFGAAIDINARFGDYWLWAKRPNGTAAWRNRVPKEIVEIFERHGFIWGGRWYHFDTLHFEYRPELIALAKREWPRE